MGIKKTIKRKIHRIEHKPPRTVDTLYPRDKPKDRIQFMGKAYRYSGTSVDTKREAFDIVRAYHQQGYFTRAVQSLGMGVFAKPQWLIYIRARYGTQVTIDGGRASLSSRRMPRITPKTPRLRR